MKPAYRKANQHTFMWMVICFIGLGGQMGVMWLLYHLGWEKKMQAWILVPAAVPFILAIIFGRWRLARLNRQRVQGVSATLESLGFMVSVEPKPETKASFWQSMDQVMTYLDMSRGAEAVQWLGLRGEEGSRMAVWEYHYTTGSGRTLQVHHFTCLAWPAQHPDLPVGLGNSDGCNIRSLQWLQRRNWRKQEITLPGLETFQKKWAVYGSVATATRVLTPEVLAVLARSPRYESWYVGTGWVCCSFRSTLNAQNLRRFWDHAQEVRKALR